MYFAELAKLSLKKGFRHLLPAGVAGMAVLLFSAPEAAAKQGWTQTGTHISGKTSWLSLQCVPAGAPFPFPDQTGYDQASMSQPNLSPPLYLGNTPYSYWASVSEGNISLDGSLVVDWKNSTQMVTGQNGNGWTRTQVVQACLNAALADSAVAKKIGDLSQFFGLIVHAPDSGINASFANPSLLSFRPERLTIKNQFTRPAVNKRRTLAVISDDAPGLLYDQVKGAMAYAYGLTSANQTSGGAGDGDELLGAPSIGFNPSYGLCAQHLDYLGWIPAAQHLSYSSVQAQNNLGVSTQVVLRALGAAGATPAGEYQEVQVQPIDPTSSFSFGGLTLEFRRALTDTNGNGINTYLFNGQVLIYQGNYASGSASTLRISDNSPSNSYAFGHFDHTMQPGDDFFDFEDMVVIHFDSIDSTNNTATIHISAFGGN